MRPVDADELVMFPYSEGPGTEEQIAEWIEQAGLSEDDTADRARELCWMVIEGCINVVKTQPTLTPQNEWVSVEERLPEDKQIVLFHQKNGFIYCAEYFAGNKLLSPAWFIDNDCWEAGEVTHWMPLPEPPERQEDNTDGD